MNKKILILFTTVSFIIFTNLFLLKNSAHTKIQNNHLFFTGIHNVSFTVKQHCISYEQPYATSDGSQAGSVKYLRMVGINIKAGRHGSREAVDCTSANMFSSGVSFKNNFTFCRERGPAKLNFSVKGTLAINGKYFDNIILAQGHSAASNNWWFGGNQCLNIWGNNDLSASSRAQVECTARDGTQWCFTRGATQNKLLSVHNLSNHVQVKTNKCTTT